MSDMASGMMSNIGFELSSMMDNSLETHLDEVIFQNETVDVAMVPPGNATVALTPQMLPGGTNGSGTVNSGKVLTQPQDVADPMAPRPLRVHRQEQFTQPVS